MSDGIRALSDEEVRQIRLIIESLDRSTFDFLQLEFGDVRLVLGRGNPPPDIAAASAVSGAAPAASPGAAPASASPMSGPAAPAASANAAATTDTAAITAPLVGRFYAQAEPGAAPFVTVGSEVTENTTVALIEVMKTFNAVPAGMRGIVTEICVQDSQFVEYGQVLFRVRPVGT
jgi:acetyl-CoA carboxylase biotin carboxyl carrier protein